MRHSSNLQRSNAPSSAAGAGTTASISGICSQRCNSFRAPIPTRSGKLSQVSVHFHSLKIAEVVPETADAVSLRFEIPAELEDAFAFKPGQHLTLRATIDGEEVRRNYSLCTAPDERDWMVTIKRMPGGFFSQWAPQNLKAGDVLEVMEPHGSFTTDLDRSNRRHLVAIAGGSGITPVMSLIKSA